VRFHRILASSRRGFAGRVGVVFGGTALGQAAAFVLLPLTAQVYGADIIGQAASVLAALGILALVVCLQYDNALIVAHNGDVPYLMIVASLAAVGWALAISLLCVVDPLIPEFRWAAFMRTVGIDWTLAVLLICYAPYLLLTNLHLRLNSLRKVGAGRLIYYSGGAVMQLAGGLLFGPRAEVYLLGQAVGAFVAVLYLLPYRLLPTWVIAHTQSGLSLREEMRRVVFTYREFPQYQAGAGLLNALSINVPTVFMRIAFSDAWAGWYYVAFRALASPANLAGQAVGQIYFRDSAERERNGQEQARAIERIVSVLLRAELIPILILTVFAPMLVDLVMGHAWAPVGVIIQLLAVSYVVTFPASPISQILSVKRLQSRSLLFNGILFAARVAGLYAGYRLGSEVHSVAGYSLASILVFLPFLRYCVHSVGGSVWRAIQPAMPEVKDVVFIALMAILFSSQGVLNQAAVLAIIALLAGMAAYREIGRFGLGKNGESPRSGSESFTHKAV